MRQKVIDSLDVCLVCYGIYKNEGDKDAETN